MGKGTDKLYITHSEWSSAGGYSASGGARSAGNSEASFRKLPFNFCAASLQPFKNPVCTPEGTIFDVEVISTWLDKHPNQNPVDGKPLQKKDLIKLNFHRNTGSDVNSAGTGNVNGDLIDPVTFKVFTDNTHIIAIRHNTYANVFSWDTVERMNIKAKMWQDLMDDEPFTRADIITLQDPLDAGKRNINAFKHLQNGTESQILLQNNDGLSDNIQPTALRAMKSKVQAAKAAVEKARQAREAGGDVNRSSGALTKAPTSTAQSRIHTLDKKRAAPNSANYTTGRAAASFTSTGLTPETSGERALLTDEEFMLKPKRVKSKGYARVETNLGNVNIELHTDTAPKAVWNFIRLAQKGYYKGVAFHRNIPGFMIQGGDPSGTGKGGASIWGKYFDDEFDGPQAHEGRGIVSMANKGKNTNSSQFFFTYKSTPHLDRKHTIFGRIVSGLDTLAKMENVPTDGSNRPLNKIAISDIVIFVDPFEEFQNERRTVERQEREQEEIIRQGGTEADKTTWTGKRLRNDGHAISKDQPAVIGKYLSGSTSQDANSRSGPVKIDSEPEPAKKKLRGTGGFGNFDGW